MVHSLRVLLFLFAVLAPVSHAAIQNFDSDDPYEILGVQSDVDDEGLVEAWRTLIKTLHPDVGGENEHAKVVIEAYRFLKKHRLNYDQGLMPFRWHFKEGQDGAIVLPAGQEAKYQALLQRYLSFRTRALDLAARGAGNRAVFVLYAMLNLNGDRGRYMEFKPYQLRAYRALISDLGLLNLTRSELAAILLRDPVEALQMTLEHYDNFNIRLPTLQALFHAYDLFYLRFRGKSLDFLSLVEHMTNNQMFFDPRGRFDIIRAMALKSFKTWLRGYLGTSRNERRILREQYKRTRKLVFRLEGFPKSIGTCAQLLVGIPPR